MKISHALLVALLTAGALAHAESPFGFGIKGGVGLTNAFNQTYGSGNLASTVLTQSAAKDYIVGPSAEFRLPLGFSVEADALYRPVSFETISSIAVTSTSVTPGPWVESRRTTFEFPLLAKYRLPLARLKPSIQGGPSFRSGASGQLYGLGHYGLTFGAGLEFKLPVIRLSSDLRYTRWDVGQTIYALPNRNQVELLFGVSF